MEVVASLVVLHLCQIILALILPIPSSSDSYLFFVILMLIESAVSVTVTKIATGRTNTMIAVTIYIFGMWLLGPSVGFSGFMVVLVMWIVNMFIAIS